MIPGLAPHRVWLFWQGAEAAREMVAEFGWDAAYGHYATTLGEDIHFCRGFKAHLDVTLEREANR